MNGSSPNAPGTGRRAHGGFDFERHLAADARQGSEMEVGMTLFCTQRQNILPKQYGISALRFGKRPSPGPALLGVLNS